MAEQPRPRWIGDGGPRSTSDLLSALAAEPSPTASTLFADELETRLLAVAEALPSVEDRPGDRVVTIAPKPWALSPAAWAVAALILIAVVVGPRFLAADGVRLDDAIMATVTLPDGTVVEAVDGLTIPDGAIIEVGEDGEVVVGEVVLLPGSRARVVDGTVIVIVEPTPNAEPDEQPPPRATEVSGPQQSTSTGGRAGPARGEERQAGAPPSDDDTRLATDARVQPADGREPSDPAREAGDGRQTSDGGSSDAGGVDGRGTSDRPAVDADRATDQGDVEGDPSDGRGSAGDGGGSGASGGEEPVRDNGPGDVDMPDDSADGTGDDSTETDATPVESRPTRDPDPTGSEGEPDGSDEGSGEPPADPSEPADPAPTRPPTRADEPPAAPSDAPAPPDDGGAPPSQPPPEEADPREPGR